jgi:hypothetical protein
MELMKLLVKDLLGLNIGRSGNGGSGATGGQGGSLMVRAWWEVEEEADTLMGLLQL